MGIYAIAQPPDTTEEFYRLPVDNPVLGVLSLDALYPVSNALAFFVYLSLALLFWRVNRSAVTIAIALGTVGMAAYMASPRAVEMLSLAHAYAYAYGADRVALLATGDGMLATWMGTAFDIYYVLNGVALVIWAVLMLRSTVVSRATAVWALAAAVLMAVPSNFGVVGLVFAIASLVPWIVFSVLVARRLQAVVREMVPDAATSVEVPVQGSVVRQDARARVDREVPGTFHSGLIGRRNVPLVRGRAQPAAGRRATTWKTCQCLGPV